ncbi:MAG: transketolase [Oligoflexia bacterium]|nr:transketolase [Oligoflexia bacterium]
MINRYLNDLLELKSKAKFIRQEILRVCIRNGAGHIASSFSTIEILVALYYSIMKIDLGENAKKNWPKRDRLIFSKAHGCYALYAILADLKLIKQDDFENFYKGSFLSGCLERREDVGLEASCGSLGHGLPQAVGLAFSAKLKKDKFRVYVVIGDGEMQEGSNWEAIQFAVKHKLDNLKIIIDNNNLQAMDFLQEVLSFTSPHRELAQKVRAFGCYVKIVNGHNLSSLTKTLHTLNLQEKTIARPQVVVARTIKGRGLKCMENIPKFHFRLPTNSELSESEKNSASCRQKRKG